MPVRALRSVAPAASVELSPAALGHAGESKGSLVSASCEVVDLAGESVAVGPHILLVTTIALTIRDMSRVDTAERTR